jgi:CheY-like chemotaxis protein
MPSEKVGTDIDDFEIVQTVRNLAMLGTPTPQRNLQGSRELTPRDDTRKITSEILKRVDQFIKKGELDQAQLEIRRAKEIDPRNVYALALEERITFLKSEPVHTNEVRPENSVKQSADDAKKGSKPENIPAAFNYQQSVSISSIKSKIAEVPKPGSDYLAIARKKETFMQDSVLDRSIELESYRKTLSQAWSNGIPSSDETRQLNELRSLFEITDSEHEGMEKNVKRECYKNAIVQRLSNNPATLTDENSVADLRRMFHVTEDEHNHIQKQLLDIMQQKQRNKVLIIDDDTRLLELLADSLENNGFDVIALSTSDEAYAFLRKFVPDIILCDINLETSTMGGFTFYEKVQELKNIQSIPFVFLTGLTDETLVRTGKELGVDDYLTKPISEQTLISTIRGKLKRFKQLRDLASQLVI